MRKHEKLIDDASQKINRILADLRDKGFTIYDMAIIKGPFNGFLRQKIHMEYSFADKSGKKTKWYDSR